MSPPASHAAMCSAGGCVPAFYGCRTAPGMAARGGLPPRPLYPGRRAAARGRACSHCQGTQAAGGGGGRNIALLDKWQCCDGNGRKHRNGGNLYGQHRQFTSG